MTMLPEDKEKIENSNLEKQSLTLSFGAFYIKPNKSKGISGYNEIIACELAREVNLICPQYFLYYNGEESMILSEDISNYGPYLFLSDLNFKELNSAFLQVGSISLYDFWNSFSSYNNISDKLMIDLLKIYLFDLFFMNFDRNLDNIGILEDQKGLFILDNEYIFSDEYPSVIHSQFDNTNYDYVSDNPLEERLKDLKNFFQVTSSEQLEIFDHFFQLLTPEHLKEIFAKIEKKYFILTPQGNLPFSIPDKERYFQKYQKNYDAIDNLWKELRNGRK